MRASSASDLCLLASIHSTPTSLSGPARWRYNARTMDDERETVLFIVSREVAQAAIGQVSSCEACNPDAAEFPFECVLDRFMMFPARVRLPGFHIVRSFHS